MVVRFSAKQVDVGMIEFLKVFSVLDGDKISMIMDVVGEAKAKDMHRSHVTDRLEGDGIHASSIV